jgi:hypothetical protein
MRFAARLFLDIRPAYQIYKEVNYPGEEFTQKTNEVTTLRIKGPYGQVHISGIASAMEKTLGPRQIEPQWRETMK